MMTTTTHSVSSSMLVMRRAFVLLASLLLCLVALSVLCTSQMVLEGEDHEETDGMRIVDDTTVVHRNSITGLEGGKLALGLALLGASFFLLTWNESRAIRDTLVMDDAQKV